MGDDVICIDSDDDDEDDANAVGRTHGARAGSRRAGGRGYWQQRRRAKRARRKLDSAGLGGSPLALLLDGLRRLSSEMSFGAVSSHSVAQRVHRLIGEFERCKSLTVTDRQEGWRQVLRLLLVLRTVGGLGPGERDPQSDAGRAKDLQEVERQTGNRPPNNKLPPVPADSDRYTGGLHPVPVRNGDLPPAATYPWRPAAGVQPNRQPSVRNLRRKRGAGDADAAPYDSGTTGLHGAAVSGVRGDSHG
uniref:Uncharacterized protein n=1 Tax=Anopheles atroparvus TaxID=41427 RepID=A0AAG5D5N6_ANOAO